MEHMEFIPGAYCQKNTTNNNIAIHLNYKQNGFYIVWWLSFEQDILVCPWPETFAFRIQWNLCIILLFFSLLSTLTLLSTLGHQSIIENDPFDVYKERRGFLQINKGIQSNLTYTISKRKIVYDFKDFIIEHGEYWILIRME